MKWVSAFSYLPINYGVELAQIRDQTQRVSFESNLNGERVRLRMSNRYSKSELCLASVTVGILRDGRVEPVRPVTRGGSREIRLAPGEEAWSDETELTVRAGDRLAVTSYVDRVQGVESVCAFWSAAGPLVQLGRSGDHTDGSPFESVPCAEIYPVIAMDANPVKAYFFYGLSGVQVLTDDRVKTVAMFGDSITHMAFVSNALAARLASAYPGRVSVINRGIGGNRLLYDATKIDFLPAEGACFGPAGVRRFEEDVFGQESVDAVLVLEGINDIMHPIQFDHPEELVTAEELESGFRQLIAVARRHGARIFGATITPSGSSVYPAGWMPRFEEVRTEINRRLREGIGFDGCFDYDAAVRDEARPDYMREDCHICDGLHPNDLGGARMAEHVDLAAIME
jgi:Lysophospholipase L1 and related esterases